MNALQKAIYQKAISDPGLMGKITSIYPNEAPENAQLPYIVFYPLTETPEYTFNTSFENCTYQLSIWSANKKASEAGAIFEEVKRVFDYCQLLVDGYTCIYAVREFSTLIKDPSGLWHLPVRYRFYLQKL